MAVANPQSASLNPAYANIIETLNKRADIASQDPGKYGIANAVATPLVEQAKLEQAKKREQQLLTFKAGIEEDLNNRQFERDMKKEGRELVTPEDAAEMERQLGLPEGSLASAVGRYVTQQETEDILQSRYLELFAQELEEKDPLQAKAIRAAGKEGANEYLKGINKKTPPSLTPALREQSLRKEFAQRVKETGFLNKRDAYTGALNAEKNVSVTNDVNLIYSVAKARDNTGRLSDQDIEQAARAGNLPGDLQRYFNQITTTKELLPAGVRKTLIDSVKQLYSQAEGNLTTLEETYKSLAENEELNANNVIQQFRPKEKEEEKIKVIRPDGKTSTIPKSSWEEAKKRGYKRVE